MRGNLKMFYRKLFIPTLLSATLFPVALLAGQAQDLETMVTCKQTDSAIQTAKDIQGQKDFKNAGGNFYTPIEQIKPIKIQ